MLQYNPIEEMAMHFTNVKFNNSNG